jgi:hypothetical protein
LGTLSQEDLDISINLLRDRVAMPHLVLSNITNDPNWQYPDLSPIINEVRRERLVELVSEDFRRDDLFRWAAMKYLIGTRPIGAMADQFNNDPDCQLPQTVTWIFLRMLSQRLSVQARPRLPVAHTGKPAYIESKFGSKSGVGSFLVIYCSSVNEAVPIRTASYFFLRFSL